MSGVSGTLDGIRRLGLSRDEVLGRLVGLEMQLVGVPEEHPGTVAIHPPPTIDAWQPPANVPARRSATKRILRGESKRRRKMKKASRMAIGEVESFPGWDDTVTAPPYVAAMKYGSRTGRRFRGRKISDGVAVERVA